MSRPNCACNPGPSPIINDATPYLPGLSPLAGKPLTAAMDAGNLSANGGLVVLREVADRLGPILGITHVAPTADDHALEVPSSVKRRLGLDDKPSWIVTTKANVFTMARPRLASSL